MMKLVDKKTGVEIPKGSRRKTFRGDEVIVEGFMPPRYSGSTGRVYLQSVVTGDKLEYYPGVIDAEIV